MIMRITIAVGLIARKLWVAMQLERRAFTGCRLLNKQCGVWVTDLADHSLVGTDSTQSLITPRPFRLRRADRKFSGTRYSLPRRPALPLRRSAPHAMLL